MPTNWLQSVVEFPRRHSRLFKTAVLFAVLAVAGLVFAYYERTPRLSHLQVQVLSGNPSGNYHAIVEKLAAEAKRLGGQIENLSSAGTVENITRLAAGRETGKPQFALAQDGMDWPADGHFELIGRLGIPESFILLGREADALRALSELRGKRVGIGPVGSGTERVARQIFAQFPELNLKLSTPSLSDQLDQLARGELDLCAMVINENAQLLTSAIRERQFQIFDFADAEVLARRFPFTRAGIIRAGQYDLVKTWPPSDKHVIQIDTLVIGNGRASWAATQALITTLSAQFPEFSRMNRDQPNRTGLPMSNAARSYFDHDGPDTVGVHAPWLVNLMPTASWIQLILGFSLLFNGMAFWHRFRLWRIDVARVHLENEIPELFEPGITVEEIAIREPGDRRGDTQHLARLDDLTSRLSLQILNCREQCLSVLVPMGQEMSYRYQEALMTDLLRALRTYRAKL